SEIDIHDPGLFIEYYADLYDIVKPASKKKDLLEAIRRQDFVGVAAEYRVIDQNTINVLVPYDPDDSGDRALYRALADEVRGSVLTRRWMAKARPYTVGLFKPRAESHDPVLTYLDPVPLGRSGFSDQWYVYLEPKHYDRLRGLVLPATSECLI
ncbi:MAG: hypothetical protein NTU41_09485, partial [Chloroflexi bacterium]|nr:hypothetical protein [Chloroflexota bacterium]